MHRSTGNSKKITSWQVIGSLAAHFRKVARLTQEQLAEALNISADTIGSVEQGRRPLKPDLAERMDEALETKGALAIAVERVPERERFPAFAQDFVEHEREAVGISSYETQVVPGLLQTPAYARAVFSCLHPPVHGDTAEDWVAARMDRQGLWERDVPPPPVADFILEESILHRSMGDPEVMREQLERLRRSADLPYISIQIVPTSTFPHAGLTGPLVLLKTPDHEDVAYVEAHLVSFMPEEADQISILQQKYGMLRSQALSPAASVSLLDELLGGS